MKHMKLKWPLRLFSIVLLAFFLLFMHTLYITPLKPNWLYERVFMKFAFENPQLLSSMRILPTWMDWYSDDLTDQGLAHEKKMQELTLEALSTLRKYDRKSMNEADALNYDMFEYFLVMQVEGLKFAHHNYPLNQLFGIQSEFPSFMSTEHPVTSAQDAENYLARLNKAPLMVNQVMEGLLIREQ